MADEDNSQADDALSDASVTEEEYSDLDMMLRLFRRPSRDDMTDNPEPESSRAVRVSPRISSARARLFEVTTFYRLRAYSDRLNRQPVLPDEVGGTPPGTNFDVALAAQHTYLGEDMEELSGRTLHDEGSILWLPIVLDLGIILVPGQTLPLSVSYTPTIRMLREAITKDKTFGILCIHVQNKGSYQVGTTAEIYEYQEGWRMTTFKIKAKGRQRFRLLEEKREMPGLIYGRVQILPEIHLSPLLDSRFSSLNKYRKNESFRSKNGLFDGSTRPWPRWVYSQYDGDELVHRIISNLTELNYVVTNANVPKDALSLSYWVMQSLPFDDIDRLVMLNMDTSIERLRYAIHLLELCTALYCKLCGTRLALRRDIFSMSIEGPQGPYCNPGGHVHEIFTVYKARGMELVNSKPSTEFSWFPGYGWTIAHCSSCKRHIGWLFTAVKRRLVPLRFWGLSKQSVTMYQQDEDEERQEERLDDGQEEFY